MKLLALETSQLGYSLALAENDQLKRYCTVKQKRLMEQTLMRHVRQLLRKANWTLDGIDVVAVSLGPGSFTGLRVGLASAKALVFGSRRRLIGVPSHDVIAASVAPSEDAMLCVMQDARREMVFRTRYRYDRMWQLEEATMLIPREEARAAWKGGQDKMVVEDAVPHAKTLIQLAWQRARYKQWDDPHTLAPVYVYSDACQVKTKRS